MVQPKPFQPGRADIKITECITFLQGDIIYKSCKHYPVKGRPLKSSVLQSGHPCQQRGCGINLIQDLLKHPDQDIQAASLGHHRPTKRMTGRSGNLTFSGLVDIVGGKCIAVKIHSVINNINHIRRDVICLENSILRVVTAAIILSTDPRALFSMSGIKKGNRFSPPRGSFILEEKAETENK